MAAPMGNDAEENKTIHAESRKTAFWEKDDPPAKDTAFIIGSASVSLLIGFGVSLYHARRKDASLFKKLLPQHTVPDDGAALATKALAYATVLSVSSCGLLVFGVFKLLGVNNATEFGQKLREYFPKKETKGRGEFKDLKDLADYLVSQARQDDIEKNRKPASKDQS